MYEKRDILEIQKFLLYIYPQLRRANLANFDDNDITNLINLDNPDGLTNLITSTTPTASPISTTSSISKTSTTSLISKTLTTSPISKTTQPRQFENLANFDVSFTNFVTYLDLADLDLVTYFGLTYLSLAYLVGIVSIITIASKNQEVTGLKNLAITVL